MNADIAGKLLRKSKRGVTERIMYARSEGFQVILFVYGPAFRTLSADDLHDFRRMASEDVEPPDEFENGIWVQEGNMIIRVIRSKNEDNDPLIESNQNGVRWRRPNAEEWQALMEGRHPWKVMPGIDSLTGEDGADIPLFQSYIPRVGHT